MDDLNYIFGDDMVYAVHEGQFVASADSIEELEKMSWGNPGDGYAEHGLGPEHGAGGELPCRECGGEVDPLDGRCLHCGYSTVHGDPFGHDHNVHASVIGPGGIKGTILAKTRDIWGEEVAVRFANGRIAHLRVVPDGTLQGGFKASTEKVASTTRTAAEDLQVQLDAGFDTGREGIVARLADLDDICSEGRHHIASATAADAAAFDSIIVAAEVERGTLREALEAIDAEAAANAEFAPYDIQAAPAQASLGSGEGNWLDSTVSAMIADAESQDFDTIVREGALLFVADLNDGALADTGVTRDMAVRDIRSRTAGIDPAVAQEIERDYLAAVEAARRDELSTRAAAVQKHASVDETDPYADLPDDILFS